MRVAFVVLFVGCRIGFDPLATGDGSLGDDIAGDAAAVIPDLDPTIPFSAPALIDLGGQADNPWISENELELYFDSDRAGGPGAPDIWVARRANRTDTWGTPALVAELDTADNEEHPVLSADNLEIYFESQRPGTLGMSDMYRATRSTITSPWGPPVRVLEVSSADDEESMYATGLVGILTVALGNRDLYITTRPAIGAPWSAPIPLTEINTGAQDHTGWLTPSGKVLYFTSTRAGGTSQRDIWYATRAATSEPFSGLTPLASLNTMANDQDASFTLDQRHVYFVTGAQQISFATR